MGDLDLPNRIVMAPLTRMRARSIDHVPTALQAEYYAQRASAGLIVAEATAISPDGFGYADTPGLWSAEQVRGWRRVATGAPLAEVDWKTVYASGPRGYSGYPSGGGRVRGLMRTRPINSVRSARKPGVSDWSTPGHYSMKTFRAKRIETAGVHRIADAPGVHQSSEPSRRRGVRFINGHIIQGGI
jgi:hypothetical protein